MDYYDNEYRRQYCRERVARARDEYRRVQAPPKNSRQRPERVPVVWMRTIWNRVRREAAQRAPAYR